MAEGKFIAYYRVSTAKQGQSGLGLEAQREAVRAYLAGKGWPPLAEFVEVESGRRNDRPQLQAALAACRSRGAVLVVARLDRLARNAGFLLTLRDAGVEFIAVDLPHANRLTVGIMALVAEEEARAISARTKAALEAARARGVKLGGPVNGTPDHMRAIGAVGVEAVRAAADMRAGRLAETVAAIQAEGITTLRGIADRLNREGYETPRGGVWTATQAGRLLARLGMGLAPTSGAA